MKSGGKEAAESEIDLTNWSLIGVVLPEKSDSLYKRLPELSLPAACSRITELTFGRKGHGKKYVLMCP